MPSFAALYAEHADDVFRFAYYLSANRAVAEDIVSETFIRVWGARERLELTTVRSYLLTIARNLYLQSQRRARRQEPLDPASAHPSLVDSAPSAEEVRAEADELAEVLSALQLLPELDRSALLLRAEENLSYEEIGSALGLTAGAARVRVHRARGHLLAARDRVARDRTSSDRAGADRTLNNHPERGGRKRI